MMRRRAFTAGALALAAVPLAARAQAPGRQHRIAMLELAEPPVNMTATGSRAYRGFFAELARLGYVEGQNLTVERWSADGRTERLGDIARTIVERRPDVILSRAVRPTTALQAATSTIPIVAIVADPVAYGFATSLSRPTGNATGFAVDAGIETLTTKRIQLLHEMAPASRFAAGLTHRFFAASPAIEIRRKAAEDRGLVSINVFTEDPVNEAEFRRVFSQMAAQGVDFIHISTNPENLTFVRTIAALAAEFRIPTAYPWREGPEAGGLMSYGPDNAEPYHQSAIYIDRLLRGARPADLPFQQPTIFEFIINLKTARAMGLSVPERLLVFATEVIE
jgi:putative tryptophan/tyrosine transport system substrate-binding protein